METNERRNQRGITGRPDRAESVVMAFMKFLSRQAEVTLSGLGGYQISPI